MKRLLILTACAALLLSGCRNCPWFKKNRGAPCRSNLTFDPYTTAPAVGPGCGIDAYAGEFGCGQDVTVGYGGVDCPNCQVNGGGGGFVGADASQYYGDTVPLQSSPPAGVQIQTQPVSPPGVGGQP